MTVKQILLVRTKGRVWKKWILIFGCKRLMQMIKLHDKILLPYYFTGIISITTAISIMVYFTFIYLLRPIYIVFCLIRFSWMFLGKRN